ncbi:MAG: molecular chaperone TorD family protein [Planctomycetota bacterium]
MSEAIDPEEVAALAHAARLFGDLFLFELDAGRLAALQAPELRGALAALGVEVPNFDPAAPESARALDELAAEFFAAVLSPTGGAPPVASLWQEGRYAGDVTARIADLAALAGIDFDGIAARAAPLDHLGCILLLWGEAAERAPVIADVIALDHLAWAERPLARMAAGEGFYAALARASRELVAALSATRLSGDSEG